MADNRTYDEKSLPDLMEEAADTLESASERYYAERPHVLAQGTELIDWRPANLRYVAKEFRERDDVAKQLRINLEDRVRDELLGGADSGQIADALLEWFTITPKVD